MSKVTAYRNTDRHCFCQIKFENRQRILVSIANTPDPGIRVIRLLFGVIPYKTLWEFSAGGEKKAHDRMIEMFTEPGSRKAGHPLDAIIGGLRPCKTWQEAFRVLLQAEQRFRGV